MKTLKRLIILFFMIITANISVFAANELDISQLSYKNIPGFKSVLTDLYENTYTHSGMLDLESFEKSPLQGKIKSYTLFAGNNELLSTSFCEVLSNEEASKGNTQTMINGYYTVSFSVEDDAYTVFATGLSLGNISKIQEAEVSSLLTNKRLRIEDIEFIDTEKQSIIFDESGTPIDSDELMCWAGTTANMLYYTGWGAKAGYSMADDIFDDFVKYETDIGGNITPATKDFLKWNNLNYYIGDITEDLYIARDPRLMEYAYQRMQEGYAAAIAFSWKGGGAHVVTLWGFVFDNSKDISDKAAYYAMLVTDTDNDIIRTGEDRRTAPNIMTMQKLTPVKRLQGGTCKDSWSIDEYYDNATCYEITLMKPYSLDIPLESGTKDSLNDPDLMISSIDFRSDKENFDTYNLPKDGQKSLYIDFYNDGKATDPEDDIFYSYSITDNKDESVKYSSQSLSFRFSEQNRYYLNQSFDLPSDLGPGEYTITLSIEALDKEAYCRNNSLSKTFRISENDYDNPEDTLSFKTVLADFSGNADGSVGADSTGALLISYSGSLSFKVRQYIVETSTNGSYWKTLYLGSELPQRVEGISPSGTEIYARLKVITDDIKGCDKYICTSDAIPLSFVYIYPVIQVEKTYSPIEEGAKLLSNEESIDFSVIRKATLDTEESKYFQYFILAGTETELSILHTELCKFEDETNRMDFSISELNFGGNENNLAPRDYYLFVQCYYDLDNSLWQYQTARKLGTMTISEKPKEPEDPKQPCCLCKLLSKLFSCCQK